MFKAIYTFFLLIFLAVSANAQTAVIDSILREIKSNYSPDRRISIFDVTYQKVNDNVVLKGSISDAKTHQILIEKLQTNQIQITDSIRLLPDDSLGEKHWGVVPLSVINIYSRPNFSSEMVTQSILGTPVKILDRDDGWLQIQTPDKYIGWTNTRIPRLERGELSEYLSKKKVIVTDLSTIVHETKSVKSPSVMEVLIGNILTLEDAGIKGKFTKISLPNGKKGYISSNSIQDLSKWLGAVELSGDNVVSMSKKFHGLPYFWGGTSSRGFDCSGLTKTVYFMHGVILPRDASQQFHVGEVIEPDADFENLQKGDLIYFGYFHNGSQKLRVEHVGIYIGDMRFIHSAQSVKINSLNPQDDDFEGYYVRRIVGVRRIIGSDAVKINSLAQNEWYK